MLVASAPIHAFPEFLLPVPRTIFFPSHWLLSHITIVETTENGERGVNPVAMTIINPRKEYWQSCGSNQCPSVLKSATLPTELWTSAKVTPSILHNQTIYQVYSSVRGQIYLSLICVVNRWVSATLS